MNNVTLVGALPGEPEPIKKITFWDKVKDLLQKIWEVVKLIFYALIGAVLFLANPSLFTIGLLGGIVFDLKFKEVADKISQIYKESQWKVLTLIGFGAFLSLPVTAAVVAIGYGANLGYNLLHQKKNNQDTSVVAA